MVVAMIAVRMMQSSVHEVIDVVAVRYGFVTATRAVGMPRTSHVRRALRRICLADRQHMLIDVVAMRVVHVAIVQIVDVPIVTDRGMSAIRVMLVMVIGVVRFVAGGHGFLLHGLTTFVPIGHRPSDISHCRTVPGLPMWGPGTSVRRRFHAAASRCFPVSLYLGCRNVKHNGESKNYELIPSRSVAGSSLNSPCHNVSNSKQQ
jgi:hypothetical protein